MAATQSELEKEIEEKQMHLAKLGDVIPGVVFALLSVFHRQSLVASEVKGAKSTKTKFLPLELVLMIVRKVRYPEHSSIIPITLVDMAIWLDTMTIHVHSYLPEGSWRSTVGWELSHLHQRDLGWTKESCQEAYSQEELDRTRRWKTKQEERDEEMRQLSIKEETREQKRRIQVRQRKKNTKKWRKELDKLPELSKGKYPWRWTKKEKELAGKRKELEKKLGIKKRYW